MPGQVYRKDECLLDIDFLHNHNEYEIILATLHLKSLLHNPDF